VLETDVGVVAPRTLPPFGADIGSMPIKLLAAQIRSSGSAASHWPWQG
jgi:hypothetical protein